MEYSAGRTKLATVALVTVGFALGFAEFIVIGITPDIAEIYNIPLSDAGNLVGYFAVAYAVSTPIIVLSTGRFRRFPLFVVFLVVFNVGNMLAILAPSYEVLMLARICTAIVSGVTLSTVMTSVHRIRRRALFPLCMQVFQLPAFWALQLVRSYPMPSVSSLPLLR